MTQLVARDESHIGLVMDAAAGAGHVDALTEAVCAAAWAELQAIEQAGGALAAVASGAVQARVAEAAAARRAAAPVAIGVTHYKGQPRAVETLAHPPANAQFPAAIECPRILPRSIDELAQEPAAATGDGA
jgi:methylmalonyl-CoA mutase